MKSDRYPVIVSIACLIACMVAWRTAGPALAVSPPPSSFHGIVSANGQNLPDGSYITALINGEAYAANYIQTDQGNSVYSLDVPGDDPDTVEIEGGREGDTVQFQLGGVLADQAGAWHSGTSVQLDLTLLASGIPPTMMPTISPDQSPTQTPAPVIQPSPTTDQTPQPTAQTSPTRLPTTIALTPTSFSQPSPTPSRTPQPTFQTAPAQAMSSPSLLVPVWTASSTTQASQAASPLPASTRTLVPTRPPSPTMMSSSAPTGTPIPSGQSPPASIPSATTVQTLEPAAQLAVTSVSSPAATRTAIPPARLGTKLVVPQSPETGDFSDPMVGILLIAAAVGLVLVMSIVITAGVTISYLRQPR